MKYDDILKYIGEFGTFQKRVYFSLCLFATFHGMRMIVMVFVMYVPHHRCAIPDYTNDIFMVTDSDHRIALNRSVPPGDSCHIFTPGNYTYDEGNRPMNASLTKCRIWVYDTSVFTSSAVSQFNLVCDDSIKAAHCTMIFFGGYFIGTYILGALSDAIGRKRSLFMSLTLMLCLGLGQVWVNEFTLFTVLGFCIGIATIGIFPTAYVIGLELVGPSRRTKVGMTLQLFYAAGVVLLSGLAYWIRDWRYLLLAITSPFAITLATWRCIPESPRWQIQKGRYAQARETILRAASTNGRDVPEWALDSVMPLQENGEILSKPKINRVYGEGSKAKGSHSGSLLDLVRNRTLLSRSCIVFFNWFVIFLTTLTIAFNMNNLGSGSIYLNICIAGLVELPGYIVALLVIDVLGRRRLLSSMMILSGLACLGCVASILLGSHDIQWVTVTMAMIGRMGAAGAISAIYIYSSELFPTVIRSSALAASSSWARVGSMLAPYMAAEGARSDSTFHKAVPSLVCGCLIIVAGILSLNLPETANRPLPETVEDVKHFNSKKVVFIPVQTEIADEQY